MNIEYPTLKKKKKKNTVRNNKRKYLTVGKFYISKNLKQNYKPYKWKKYL